MDHKSDSDSNDLFRSSEIMIKNSHDEEQAPKKSNHRNHIDSFNDDKITNNMKLEIPS